MPPPEDAKDRFNRLKEAKRKPLWPSGLILILAALATGLLRPPATSEAQAFGRAIGQAVLISAGVIFIWLDLVRRRN